ncbi:MULTISPECIES: nuclear transport factor 2 family protein [Actinomadura]|uniref:Ketosteroid isomerase homolog n=1 Tax=Actinomadura madurae TaxID=1993 RepID=A0A1I5EQ85_9ACTN|nr:nuclear transport factor 2 family protein [Actinomadura madurae]MCP9952756.1 nuclear transport factor 2 family protein [Actinomadura madurae]MCP9969521.1 nuclear transport factor 2 family protein [Actinomadura madurae]MCP9981973.1 nuclear transport factor 2 family protein [Actinomadura madurae]MCQ0006497.1 nuclear transport factor 2 family protein [Actinomadura madurae]MCQ0018211.1 nuclear transport factor 2 family protein [Actinomadura madurae]
MSRAVNRADVDEVHAEFYAAFEAGDFDRMSAVWADGQYAEAVSCVHPGWTMLRGRESVLRSWALIMANTSYIQFVLTDVETDVYGDHAVVTCKENILTADEDTETGFLAGGSIVATNVFVRADGEWRLLLHHGSPVLNVVDAEEE